MTFLKIIIAAAILGGVAQTGLGPGGGPGRGSSEKCDVATLRAAENFFGGVQSDIGKRLQSILQARDITSSDLGGLVAQLDSSASRLKESSYDEKLNRAIQRAETIHTQALAILKDPGNKEVLAQDLHPDDYLNEIQYQRASGAILQRKILRLRATTEEMRKYSVIMEGVMPSDQLSPRLKMRLSQLLREWEHEPESDGPGQGFASESKEENAKMVSNRIQSRAKELSAEPKPIPGIQRISGIKQVELSGPAVKVLRMSRQEVSEKSILKFIATSAEPFDVTGADQILKLRDQGVSNNVITAMLRRDSQLRTKTLSTR
jgi:hypothetical protein